MPQITRLHAPKTLQLTILQILRRFAECLRRVIELIVNDEEKVDQLKKLCPIVKDLFRLDHTSVRRQMLHTIASVCDHPYVLLFMPSALFLHSLRDLINHILDKQTLDDVLDYGYVIDDALPLVTIMYRVSGYSVWPD